MKDLKERLKKQIDTLSCDQLDNLDGYINYHYSPNDVNKDINQAKEKIYIFYKNTIAPLVNDIEVHSHYFDIKLYSGIESIFRCMASMEKDFSSDYTEEMALKCYSDLMNYAKNLQSELSFYLIKIYLKIIKQYKKKLIKFNYSGIYPNFKKEINKGIKSIKISLRLGYKLYKIKFSEEKNVDLHYEIDKDAEKEQTLLQNTLKKAKNLIEECESKHSDIVASGYSNIFLDKIIPSVSAIVSIVFAIIGIIGLNKLI